MKQGIINFFKNLCRAISWLLKESKWILVGAFFLSPVGPHVLVNYSYTQGYEGYKAFTSCTYLGSRGFHTPDYIENCPFLTILDHSDWKSK